MRAAASSLAEATVERMKQAMSETKVMQCMGSGGELGVLTAFLTLMSISFLPDVPGFSPAAGFHGAVSECLRPARFNRH
jgi:hypothetical protein